MTVYRKMNPDDVIAGLSLCRIAGWNQLARDWEMFLNLNPEGCIVAEQEKVIGTVTTARYQDHFSWIGMVLVDPAFRRQGIGMQLMHESLHTIRPGETAKLDATPAGREVYLKLGFIEEYNLSRMLLNTIPRSDKPNEARPLPKNSIPSLAEFDSRIFGAGRKELLEWMFEGAPQYAFVVAGEMEIQGYCLGRNGFNYTQIGPVIARDRNIAEMLVISALSRCPDKPVIIDTPRLDPEWTAWLNSIGFAEQRPLIRMYKGSNDFPGIPESQFAILGPEFG
jgi:GNAT superfamily N-acetyltransferase